MVANNIKSHATKVTSNNMNMVTRLSCLKPALNIIHVDGQTKGRAGKKKCAGGLERDTRRAGQH